MKIICDPAAMPSETILNKMKEGAAAACFEQENIDEEKVEISLTFVTSSEIRELNKIYRNVDKVTDVLSFPQYNDLNEISDEGVIPLGDVVICTEQALLQADEFGHSAERELVYLFVHSVCHLLGYDHLLDEDRSEMRFIEESIMTKIGVERC